MATTDTQTTGSSVALPRKGQAYKAREPDYEALQAILEADTGKSVSPEKARRLGAFLLRLTVLLDELQ